MPKVTRDEVGKAFEETQKLLDRLLIEMKNPSGLEGSPVRPAPRRVGSSKALLRPPPANGMASWPASRLFIHQSVDFPLEL